jgi:hypothetical protein
MAGFMTEEQIDQSNKEDELRKSISKLDPRHIALLDPRGNLGIGFEKVNFTKFEIDDNMMGFQLSNGKIRYAKGGIYNTTIKDNEYVITVSLN